MSPRVKSFPVPWKSRIAIDSSGNVYVADTYNHRIQKLTLNGQFVTKWGSEGSGDGQFEWNLGIAIDSSGNVYVADRDNSRIQKFTSSGQFVTKWGSYGSEDGQFNEPIDITIDRSGYVYVLERRNNRIQKFTSDGQFITKWGSGGSGDGQFNLPEGMALDNSGNVYVADSWNNRIQKFTSNGQFINKWGSFGNNAGEFSYPWGIAVSSDGKVYVSDSGNNRIQVFRPASYVPSNKVIKAIVVAGSGPYKGNNLWGATEMNANFAYRVLTYQGYTNDTIYYLSSDRNLDLNGDGKPDVDADATNSSLQKAITQWAKDAESLVLYLTGHGGNGTFEMSETEILKAEDLASWLNELQQTIQGLVTIIYDACESGSFVSKLVPPSGRQRITITSTSPGEPAYFLSQGALSFSYPFWSQIFGGAKIYDAYVMAKDVVGVAIGAGKSQNPEIDDNGNGIGNEKADGDLARGTYIGKGIVTAGSIPHISAISPDQVLNGETSATIGVEVVSTGRITRVWAIVHRPDFTNPTDTPITNLPSFDLTRNEQNGRYEGTYNGFTVMGTYTETVYAMNDSMIISLPISTKIEQTVGESPSNRCDFNGDGKTDILWRNKSTGQNVVWFMNGTTYSSYAELVQVSDTNWEIVGTGDFNGDGKTDILWRNKSTGQNVVWFMNGTTYKSSSEFMQVPDTNWEIVGTGDFSGDGKTDILWRNKSTGQNVLWFMNGVTYSSYAELMQVTDTNWLIVGTGDFNNDGKTDILWRNKTTGQNVVWYMNGANYSNYAEIMQVTDTNWQIVGTGDFNGDGKTDILWRNKSTGQNIIWFMNGATYNSYAELMQVTDTNWEIVGPK
jgi:hypothetical protein